MGKLIAWTCMGFVILLTKGEVTKIQFFCVWICLVVEYTRQFLKEK